ncbi:MAG: hypothetical protein LUD72_09985, partial [Bacteroidales bacterium]|nr:hypothetical protein [Bacteroidales bacterium]
MAKDTPYIVIDDLASTTEGVTYGYSVTDADGVILEISVTLSGAQGLFTDTYLSGEFTSLWSDNEYTLAVSYSYDLGDGEGVRTAAVEDTVYTLQKALPVVGIDLTSSKEKVDYTLSVSDDDEVIIEITVTISGAQGTFTDTCLSGEFTGLWSDSVYTLTVSYSYDLGDGVGTRTSEVSETVNTLAKESPVAEIVFIDSTTSELTFAVLFADGDSVGSITNVGLYEGATLVMETGTAYTGEITFDGLSSYTLYNVIVAYEYDLDDGTGTKTDTVELSYYTDPDFSLISVSVINTSVITVGDT